MTGLLGMIWKIKFWNLKKIGKFLTTHHFHDYPFQSFREQRTRAKNVLHFIMIYMSKPLRCQCPHFLCKITCLQLVCVFISHTTCTVKCKGNQIKLIILPQIISYQALKLLHNSHEFLPFVIYLKPPALEPDPDAIIEAEKQNGHETGSNKGSKNGSANASTNGSAKELTILPTVQLVS